MSQNGSDFLPRLVLAPKTGTLVYNGQGRNENIQ